MTPRIIYRLDYTTALAGTFRIRAERQLLGRQPTGTGSMIVVHLRPDEVWV